MSWQGLRKLFLKNEQECLPRDPWLPWLVNWYCLVLSSHLRCGGSTFYTDYEVGDEHCTATSDQCDQHQGPDISSKPFLCDNLCIVSLFDDLKTYMKIMSSQKFLSCRCSLTVLTNVKPWCYGKKHEHESTPIINIIWIIPNVLHQ